MTTRLLIKKDDGYEINFGKHNGEDLLEAITDDYAYFDWVVFKAEFDDDEFVEIVADYMQQIQNEGIRKQENDFYP